MVKRIIFLFSLIMALGTSALITSCGGEDEPALPTVQLSPGASGQITLQASQTIAASVVKFTATGDWAVEVVPASRTVSKVDWLDISHSGGPAGEYALTLYSKPNDTAAPRVALVNVSAVGNTITYRVTQEGRQGGSGDDPAPNPGN